MIFSELANINFKNIDIATALGVFFTVMLMPLTYSITNGLSAGFVSYVILKLLSGKTKELDFGVYLIVLLSLLVFILPIFTK